MTESTFSSRVLSGLKAFQRDTVDYVFKRMYEDSPPATRFLVADEVGLGKTLVARGLVARAIDHLKAEGVKRIDIVYICSNAAIARQNIRKLNLTGERVHNLPDRITLLPRDIHHLKQRELNFVAFTPGTSFSLKSSLGRYEERLLLHRMLPDPWKVEQDGAISLLAGDVRRSSFARILHDDASSVDPDIQRDFIRALEHDDLLFARFLKLSKDLGRHDCKYEEREERAAIVGRLRTLLAATCIAALQPDLIILDEFQRFKDLLRGDDPAAELAQKLFEYSDAEGRQARVLLLSATPYKMYTLHDEESGDDHFADFIETVRFLHHNDEARTESFRQEMQAYRRGLFRVDDDAADWVVQARRSVENSLRAVMVRTERLAATPDRGGMLVTREARLPVERGDLEHYRAVQALATAVGYGDTIEFWKSAPYVLNFMDNYDLKTKFLRGIDQADPIDEVLTLLSSGSNALLSRDDVERYKRVDSINGRLRSLMEDTLGRGTERWAWLPPSHRYYRLGPPFDNSESFDFTKRLVFSSWHVVPKVVAALLSYEAERALFNEPIEGTTDANTEKGRKKRSRLLVFAKSDGRLSGMPVLALLYPSLTLAEFGGLVPDPLQSADEVLTDVRERLGPLLSDLPSDETGSDEDERWYWAAPILLDRQRHASATREWFDQARLASRWQGEGAGDDEAERASDKERDDQWSAHVEAARDRFDDVSVLGRKPSDLAEVMALMAVGSPAVAALRAICRVTGGRAVAQQVLVRNAAGQIAEGFRSLFNQLELTESIRQANGKEPYWRRVLQYCVNGCIQAVLDEYAHLLAEAIGAKESGVARTTEDIASEMLAALTLRSASLRADVIDQSVDHEGRQTATKSDISFRTRYAVRYGSRAEETDSAERNRKLQDAFNSPFWPFVLCTTSVGQEGLDFHRYCHAVVHWNVPSNPVDLEQREGRVHRFKGHAVRKNVALRHAVAIEAAGTDGDPWAHMFDSARVECGEREADVSPYWVYAPEGGSRIERHLPFYPLSRDAAVADAVRRSLTVYRMAFGHARQEDIVAFLLRRLGHDEKAKAAAADLKIDLSPPRSPRREESGAEAEVQAQPIEREVDVSTWADDRVPLAPTSISLGRLREFLNEFRAQVHRAVINASSDESDERLHGRLRELLDAFAGLRHSTGPSDRRDVDQFSILALLDEFVRLRECEAPVNTLPRYQSLLDDFRSLVTTAARETHD